MNMQGKSAAQRGAQAGFTLIELIVVIVILGILAATALPRFTNLTGDARAASMAAARGSIQTASSIVHGQWLVTPANPMIVDGTSVAVAFGYPTAAAVAAAAGIDASDYTVISTATAVTANNPAVLAGQAMFTPKAIAGTPTALTCYVMYTQAADASTPPVVSASPTVADCKT